MATITTDEDFRKAASWWLANQAVLTGPAFVDAYNRWILDEGAANADITPDTATLEAALDSAHAAIAAEQQTQTVQDGAKADAAAIPSWASWDEATALAWHDTNLTNALPVADLTEANALLDDLVAENRALIRLVIALRNKIWPDLQA